MTLALPLIELVNVNVEFPLSYNRVISTPQKITGILKQCLTKLRKNQNEFKFQALKDISFKANKGEIIGVIGPNGGGKTTLLRAISGIYQPDTGKVITRGKLSTLLSLGTGFNNDHSGRVNIYLIGYLMGMTEQQIIERLDSIVEYSELGDYIDVPVKYYSNGMISRLGFSIATSMSPEILLIDEVFSVGDLTFKEKSEKTIDELLSASLCQVIVTHDLDLAQDHCNRVLLISGGKLIKDGKPEEVIDYYKEYSKSNEIKKYKDRFKLPKGIESQAKNSFFK